jgi:hypothetical protein
METTHLGNIKEETNEAHTVDWYYYECNVRNQLSIT